MGKGKCGHTYGHKLKLESIFYQFFNLKQFKKTLNKTVFNDLKNMYGKSGVLSCFAPTLF